MAKLGENNILGGKVYDALHAACAEKSKVERIYTFNVRDFVELAGTLSDRVTAP